MRKIYCIAWLAALTGSLPAQTNVTDASNPPRPPTVITSEHAEFDLAARRAIYYDNVRVVDPKMTLTCVRLTGDLPQSQETGTESKHIVALTNVVIISVDEKGQTNHATSDMAVYDFKVENGVTNETVTLTGNAKMENSQGTLTGEPIIWDRQKNRLTAVNQKMIVNQSAASVLANTNTPADKTNSASKMPDLPTTKTNLPPGTIENIDRITAPSTTQ